MVDTCEETEIMMLKLIKKILCFAISAILMINIHSANGMIVLAEDNETIIYQYLRNELQLNEAGASGVLSNLFFESSFNPNASSPGGSYYGIVQWGGGRKTNLENYAASLGVDRSDLKAQLDFMKQELNMAYYRSVYNDLLSVDNTADGAAQAADIFKRRYEVASDPKDRTQKARDFFAKYYVAPTPTPSPVPTPVPSSTPTPSSTTEPVVNYTLQGQGHQSEIGWLSTVGDGQTIGNDTNNKNLEAAKLIIENALEADLRIVGDAHVSGIGWINNQEAGNTLGTVGAGRAIEGLRLRLAGRQASQYQIYYRAYAKGYGWLGWASSDELAGSTDHGIPLQAVQVMITLKGTQQPSPLGNSSINRSVPTPKPTPVPTPTPTPVPTPTPSPVPTPVPSSTPTPSSTTEPVVNYTLQGQGHQSEIGWLSTVGDGQTIGNDTNNKNLEAAKLIIENALEADLRIVGDAHVSGIGWINNQEAGNTLGTVGAGRAIEGLRLRLAGRQASQYQIYYRAYAKGYGWLGWASSNELAGSIGHGVPVQAIQVKLVKNGESAPSPLGDSEVEFPYTYTVTGHQANVGWIPEVINDGVVGNVNTGNALEAFKITFLGSKPGDIGVQADAHVSTIGWINNQDASQVVGGTVGSGHALEGIRLRLVGNKANKYNLYYRVYIEQFGWLGWANANELAGSENLSLHIQGLQVKAVMKKYDDGSLANDQNESYVTEPKTGFASIIRNGRRMQVYFYNGQIVTWNFREGRNFYHVDPSTGEILTLQTTRSDSVWAEGIDISEHNYGINLADYQNGFVIIRIGYSTKEDKHWREYLRICEQLHIPYGVYLYSYALNDADAVEEAKFTLNILSQIHPTLGVWFDMEDADGYKQRHAPWILNKTTISSITRTYLDIVATSGHTVGIYASSSWFSNYIDVPGYPKWVANWGVNDGQWHNDFSNQAYMQQYTSFENLDRDLLFIDPNLIR